MSLWQHWQQWRKDVRHSGDRVDRIGNKVDHTCDKVDRVGDNVDRNKLSYSRCCRFVAKTGNKVDRIGDRDDCIGDSRLCCRFVAGFGNSRQCVPGFSKYIENIKPFRSNRSRNNGRAFVTATVRFSSLLIGSRSPSLSV